MEGGLLDDDDGDGERESCFSHFIHIRDGVL
jgi:hypothetical protein